jgi:hypothetical protein
MTSNEWRMVATRIGVAALVCGGALRSKVVEERRP